MDGGRSDSMAKNKSSKLLGLHSLVCIVAALFMLVGASYTLAHDHDDHAAEFEGECVVCSVAALSGAKASPDDSSLIDHIESFIERRLHKRAQFSKFSLSNTNPARAPPFSIPSC